MRLFDFFRRKVEQVQVEVQAPAQAPAFSPASEEVELLKAHNEELNRLVKSLDRKVRSLEREPATKQDLLNMMPAQYWNTSINNYFEFADALEKFHNIKGTRK